MCAHSWRLLANKKSNLAERFLVKSSIPDKERAGYAEREK